jgi:hypothetical protein
MYMQPNHNVWYWYFQATDSWVENSLGNQWEIQQGIQWESSAKIYWEICWGYQCHKPPVVGQNTPYCLSFPLSSSPPLLPTQPNSLLFSPFSPPNLPRPFTHRCTGTCQMSTGALSPYAGASTVEIRMGDVGTRGTPQQRDLLFYCSTVLPHPPSPAHLFCCSIICDQIHKIPPQGTQRTQRIPLETRHSLPCICALSWSMITTV